MLLSCSLADDDFAYKTYDQLIRYSCEIKYMYIPVKKCITLTLGALVIMCGILSVLLNIHNVRIILLIMLGEL